MSEKYVAYLELSAAMVIVGSSVVVGKLITASFPVFLASTARLILALPILLMLVRERLHEEVQLLQWRDWIMVFLQAFTGVFLFNALLLYALDYTTAIESGIITSLTPALIGIISWLFLREKITLWIGTGIILSMCGVLVINILDTNADTVGGTNPLLGNLLVFGAVVGEALFTIFRKATANTVSPLLSSTLVTVFGLVLFLPVGLIEAVSFDFRSATWIDYGVLIYSGIALNVLAYILWFGGVGKVPASTAAAFTGILPISAILLSAVILGEKITAPHLLGLMSVVGGIAFITRSP